MREEERPEDLPCGRESTRKNSEGGSLDCSDCVGHGTQLHTPNYCTRQDNFKESNAHTRTGTPGRGDLMFESERTGVLNYAAARYCQEFPLYFS